MEEKWRKKWRKKNKNGGKMEENGGNDKKWHKY